MTSVRKRKRATISVSRRTYERAQLAADVRHLSVTRLVEAAIGPESEWPAVAERLKRRPGTRRRA